MESKTPRVAIQGIRASFHEEAAFKYFGANIQTVECNSFKQTFEALKNKEADYLVMAIENHFLTLPGVKFEDIKTVISHPIALRQCVDFIDEYPQLKVVESNDTAACAKRVHDQQLTDTAAIANSLAAKLYNLEIMERRIESNKKNFTRFLIFTNHENAGKVKANKASLCFQVANQAGALVKVLNILAEQNINMSKVQSMPILGKRNEYNFYVDIEWNNTSEYDTAIRQILKHTQNFNILGEYERYEDLANN
jgi:prephenate dehydratase